MGDEEGGEGIRGHSSQPRPLDDCPLLQQAPSYDDDAAGAPPAARLVWAQPAATRVGEAVATLLTRLRGDGDHDSGPDGGGGATAVAAELARLLVVQRHEQQAERTGESRGVGIANAGSRLARRTSYRLYPAAAARRTNAVLRDRSSASAGGARAVYDRPDAERGQELGQEVRDLIAVVEVRDGGVWLRMVPERDDTSQCWLRARGASDGGEWRPAEARSAAARRADFAVRTGLRMLSYVPSLLAVFTPPECCAA
jgi:hypothetical protein